MACKFGLQSILLYWLGCKKCIIWSKFRITGAGNVIFYVVLIGLPLKMKIKKIKHN